MMYWEDFQPGDRIDMGRHTFGADEIIAFARQFDPQPFHVDPEAAKRSFFGGLIASGWHTCSVGMRLTVESHVNQAASLGSPGLENIRWLKPVRAGDTISYSRVVLESRASESRPGVGLVKSRWEAVNQAGETVMTMEGWGMFGRRPK
ncbi:MAG: MaoC family dehydratase [Clostridia bacterium]